MAVSAYFLSWEQLHDTLWHIYLCMSEITWWKLDSNCMYLQKINIRAFMEQYILGQKVVPVYRWFCILVMQVSSFIVFLKYLNGIFFIYWYCFRGKRVRVFILTWNYRSQWWVMPLYINFAFHLNIIFQFQFFAVFSHADTWHHI